MALKAKLVGFSVEVPLDWKDWMWFGPLILKAWKR
jgi:hypothetical protein